MPAGARAPAGNCPCCPLYLRDWRRRERRCLPLRWARSRRASLQRGRLRASVCQSFCLSVRPRCRHGLRLRRLRANEALSWPAQFSSAQPAADNRRMTSAEEWLRIESLDLEAQGVAHNGEGKVVFVEDALPGEEVRVARASGARTTGSRRRCVELRRESSQRVVPRCPHFGVCGGCKMQHLDVAAQVATKQRALEDALWHLGKVRPERVLRPMRGPGLGLSPARAPVGAPRRQEGRRCWSASTSASRATSPTSGAATCCRAHVSDLLLPLRELIAAMDARDRLPQIELAIGDARHRARAAPPRAAGRRRPRAAARVRAPPRRPMVAAAEGPGDGATARRRGVRSWPTRCPSSACAMPFRPTDFTQVNHADQRGAGRRARCACSTPQPDERVIDWFCGLGNFTLPLATRAARGARHRGQRGAGRARARAAAALNGLAAKTPLRRAQPVRDRRPPIWSTLGSADKWLIDPPREGAFAIAKALADLATRRRRRRRPRGGRRSASSTSAATRRRWRATPACWCTSAGYRCVGGGRRQHVPAHGARREHRGLRPRRRRAVTAPRRSPALAARSS